MSQDPFNPFNQGRGSGKIRELNRLSNRTGEEFALDHEVREMRRQRRRELLRRLFRRGT